MYIVYIPAILGILIYKYIISREFYFRDLLIESYKPSYIYIFISYLFSLIEVFFFGESGFNQK